ncbi:MAG: pyridoxal phosphate-dependent aminotransferase [Clostridia bacterium]
MELSKKIQAMELSPIRKFVPYADAARAAGKKVYGLNIGQPDIKTPRAFFDAVKNFDQDVLAYANSQGIPELLEALVGYYKRLGLDFEKKDLLVTTGGSEAISMLMTALLDDDDEVIMAEPFYTNYKTFIAAAGGKLVGIPTTAEEGYQYAVKEKIEAVITPKTKAICIINPGNPTGKVLTHDEMKLIVDIAIAHDLFIIADEVYREFVYDGKRMDTFGSFPEAAQHVIIVDSISKRFSACGARMGSIASKNEALMGNLMKICQARLCCATLDQIGAAALYNMDPSYFNDIKAEYEHRRNVAVEALNEIEGIQYGVPEGAFYITCKLPVDDAEKFLMFLLTEFDVNGETCMFAPAGGFFTNPEAGKSDMRIAYVLKAEDMKAGINIIKEGIKAYNAR